MDIRWDHGECYIGGFILDRKLPTRFTPKIMGSNSEVQLCGKNDPTHDMGLVETASYFIRSLSSSPAWKMPSSNTSSSCGLRWGSGSVMRLSLGCPIPLVNSCSLIIFPRVNWTAGVPGCGMDTRTECVFSPQRSQMPRGGCGEFGQFEELFVAAERIRELLRTIDNLYGISMDFLLQSRGPCRHLLWIISR